MATRKYAAVGSEAECQPGSGGTVLRNYPGITDPELMDAAESAALVDALEVLIEIVPADHRFTADDIRMLHRTWLGTIYAWAGEYRSVDLSKPGIDFAHAEFIQSEMARFERGCLAKYTPCVFAELEEQVTALAVTHAELVLIHPFREGNGRCARILSSLMAAQAGLPPLDFTPIANEMQAEYFAAIRAAWAKGDYDPLRSVFKRIIETTLERQR
ncbi:MAG: Fic family protein [Dehalococcoidia bacterium]|nr:Fic family protein [Dehalococcoidia bacterium]